MRGWAYLGFPGEPLAGCVCTRDNSEFSDFYSLVANMTEQRAQLVLASNRALAERGFTAHKYLSSALVIYVPLLIFYSFHDFSDDRVLIRRQRGNHERKILHKRRGKKKLGCPPRDVQGKNTVQFTFLPLFQYKVPYNTIYSLSCDSCSRKRDGCIADKNHISNLGYRWDQ